MNRFFKSPAVRRGASNIFALVACVGVAVVVGGLLKKSQEHNRLKVERAITFTGNMALEHGYACRAAHRDIEKCREELWKNGTTPLQVYGGLR